MKKFIEMNNGSGFITDSGGGIPNDPENRHYKAMMKLIASGDAEIVKAVEEDFSISNQIYNLEKQQTPRMLRCAALGDAHAIQKLEEIENAIQSLRGQL
ncbi:hypothetical protein [Vibrio phage MZH0603]|nr:hypothetical protein [Vibrio phage MZH0603]